MSSVYAISLLGIATILQTTIFSNIKLIQGNADLVLLTFIGWMLHKDVSGLWTWATISGLLIGLSSNLPIWLPVIPYFLIASIISLLNRRIWKLPIMSLFGLTIIGTFLILVIQWLYLFLIGVPINFESALNLVIIPSMLLNLIFAFPIYVIMGEIILRLFPQLGEL